MRALLFGFGGRWTILNPLLRPGDNLPEQPEAKKTPALLVVARCWLHRAPYRSGSWKCTRRECKRVVRNHNCNARSRQEVAISKLVVEANKYVGAIGSIEPVSSDRRCSPGSIRPVWELSGLLQRLSLSAPASGKYEFWPNTARKGTIHLQSSDLRSLTRSTAVSGPTRPPVAPQPFRPNCRTETQRPASDL